MFSHFGGLQTFRNDCLAVLSRAEDKIGELVAQDRFLPLLVVKGLQQSKSLIALWTERPHGFPIDRVERRLSAGQSRREDATLPGDGDVERQMMTSKLQHPGVLFRGRSEDRDVVEIFAEH